MTPAPTATLQTRAVHVYCPCCEEELYTSVTPIDSTPWGEQVKCWACRAVVRLPAYPFNAHRKRLRR